MTIATQATHRVVAALNLPRRLPEVAPFVRNVVGRMTGNPAFPAPTPPLATVTTAADALATAQSATLTRAKGNVPARNAAYVTLHGLMKALLAYVQQQADADPANAATVIESAGLSVRKPRTRPVRVFDARPGIGGSVHAVAPSAGRRASYEWEYSTDGGKTWTVAPPTLQAKTVITGLPSGSAVLVRYRPVTKQGAGDWSAPVTTAVK